MDEIPIVRLDVDLAKIMAEHVKTTDPLVRHAIDMIFRIDEEKSGPHSAEFLQGFFSGLMLARYRLIESQQPSREANLVTELAILLACKYIERSETTEFKTSTKAT